MLVAGGLGQLVGAAWGLAFLNSVAAGALALAGFIYMRHGTFAFMDAKVHQHRPGIWMFAYVVMAAPSFFGDDAVGIGLLDREDELAFSLLFGSTGFAAYTLGGIMMTLAHLEGDVAAVDPRLHRVAPPLGEPGPTPPSPVFTARSTGIGIASGVLVALALEQFLGVPWGLAILNGLAAGALALALSTGLREGLLDTTDYHQRRPGIWAVTYAVMIAPMVFVHHYIELRPADEFAVSLLFALTGLASHTLGSIMASLVFLDGDAAATDPRLHRVTPPPGERPGT